MNARVLNYNRIKELRLLHHKSQSDLANYLGITDRSIANWEKANREPKIRTWVKLARYFNVSASYLQGLDRFESNSFIGEKK